MKQLVYPIILCCLAIFSLSTCDSEVDIHRMDQGESSNRIILDLSPSSMPVTRATQPDVAPEMAVTHLDVLIFDLAGKKVWYERISAESSDGTGTITLTAPKSHFEAQQRYEVYLIANTKTPTETFQAANFDLSALRNVRQADRPIHVTGLNAPEIDDDPVPQTFLMDGKAYLQGSDQTQTQVVLNNGDQSENTELAVELRRAAAKMLFRIHKGDKVQFVNTTGAIMPGYYLRNMPYTTSLIPVEGYKPQLRTPIFNTTGFFRWAEDQILVKAYAYEHDWTKGSSLTEEVRLIVNIPLMFQAEGESEPTLRENSYYQIPVSKSKMLARNTYYEIDVTVNAPGGTDPSNPPELKDITYGVYEWQPTMIEVGGEADRPAYLTLNEEEMEMHNLQEDKTTLEFASSSPVKAEILEVWYIDKFGQRVNLTSTNNAQNRNEWGERRGTAWHNKCTIQITPDPTITGKIDVNSTIPENKTIRYIKFKITNEEGISREVIVDQYPLEYITNIQGWYSYRDDFKDNNPKPTTYEYAGDRIVGVSYNSRNDSYTYSTSGQAGFWYSKVVNKQNSDGRSQIYYYYYTSGGSRRQYQISNSENSSNARMYHVRLTASSDKYTLGRPRLTADGYTDPGADNAKLVSPSFMIASRLGFVATANSSVNWTQPYALNVARKHCENYVEVYKDEQGKTVVLDDWRLPTSAELKIIVDFQGRSNEQADAIDYLLNATYYWSASERVYNDKYSVNATSIRCIRDAYEK